MRTVIRFFIFVLCIVAVAVSCTTDTSKYTGTWVLKSNEIDPPLHPLFQEMFQVQKPSVYEEKIYIDDKQIEYPLGFKKGNHPLEDNFISYTMENGKMKISGQDSYLNLSENQICIEQNCFVRAIPFEGINTVEFIELKVKYEEELSLGFSIDNSGKLEIYHSTLDTITQIDLTANSWTYLQKLCSRIPLKDLNKLFNLNTSHAKLYELYLVMNNQRYGIVSHGLEGDTPFEIKALITNLIKMMEQSIQTG